MVYMDPNELGWRPYVKSWMQKTCTKMKDETQVLKKSFAVAYNQFHTNLLNKQYDDETHILFNQQEYLMNLFENYVDNGLNFARKKCVQAMQQVLFFILPTTL